MISNFGLGAVCFLIAAFAAKLYSKLSPGKCRCKDRLDGKTVLITGATAGIGKYTAHDLAKRGARVILACRNLEKAARVKAEIISETGNADIVIVKCDTSSLQSVRDCAAHVIATEPKLHVLINNAAISKDGNEYTEDGLQLVMHTNHFGPFLLTYLLLDLVKQSSPSRIIFVSSKSHGEFIPKDLLDLNFKNPPKHQMAVYGLSKLANVLTTKHLAHQLEGTGVTVNCLHPGFVRTDIFNLAKKRILLWPIIELALLFSRTVEEGSQTIIHLSVDPKLNNVTGKYFTDCKESEHKVFPAAKDLNLAKKICELSEKFVKL